MTVQDILTKVASKEISPADADKLIAAINPRAASNALGCKVSEKGAISVYGLQRMPVTLYVQQWDRLLAFGDQIKAFAKAHDSELSRK
jgi:hypothetical protein